MSFSGADFVSYINTNGGVANSSKYEVIIPSAGDLTLMCHTASILGKTFNVHEEVYGYGSEYNLPINEAYEDLTLSFNCTNGDRDNRIPERRFFDSWMNDIINPNTNHSSFKNEYAEDIIVHALDSIGRRTYSIKYINSFPISISDIELSAAGNELISFDVVFTFDNWLSNERIGWKEPPEFGTRDWKPTQLPVETITSPSGETINKNKPLSVESRKRLL